VNAESCPRCGEPEGWTLGELGRFVGADCPRVFVYFCASGHWWSASHWWPFDTEEWLFDIDYEFGEFLAIGELLGNS